MNLKILRWNPTISLTFIDHDKQEQKQVYLCSVYEGFTHHAEPWGSHGPRQTQQNSALQFWFLHTMWLQPPSFSMVTWHFGHSCRGTDNLREPHGLSRLLRDKQVTPQLKTNLSFTHCHSDPSSKYMINVFRKKNGFPTKYKPDTSTSEPLFRLNNNIYLWKAIGKMGIYQLNNLLAKSIF